MCNRRVFSERELVELGKSDTADPHPVLQCIKAWPQYFSLSMLLTSWILRLLTK